MRAKQIMTPHPVWVAPGATVKDAAAIMVRRGFNALPVLDEAGRLVGIVSEGDLIGLQTQSDPRLHLIVTPSRRAVPASVADVMTAKVVALDEECDVADVARAMLDAKVKQIPIVSRGRLVGIVARCDLLRLVARGDGAIEADVRHMLRGAAGLIGRFSAEVEDGTVVLSGSDDPVARKLAERLARCVPGTIAVAFEDEPRAKAGSPSAGRRRRPASSRGAGRSS